MDVLTQWWEFFHSVQIYQIIMCYILNMLWFYFNKVKKLLTEWNEVNLHAEFLVTHTELAVPVKHLHWLHSFSLLYLTHVSLQILLMGTSQLDKRINIKQISSNSVSIWKYPKLNNFTFTGYISSWLVYGKYELFLLPGAWWRCQGHLWLLLPPASSWTIQSGQQVLSSLAFVFSSINSSSRSPCQDSCRGL